MKIKKKFHYEKTRSTVNVKLKNTSQTTIIIRLTIKKEPISKLGYEHKKSGVILFLSYPNVRARLPVIRNR